MRTEDDIQRAHDKLADEWLADQGYVVEKCDVTGFGFLKELLQRAESAEREREAFEPMNKQTEQQATPVCNKSLLATERAAREAEQGEWQQAIYELVCRLCPEASIDGKGSDAGPLEFTLAEIGQGLGHWIDKYDAEHTARVMAEGVSKQIQEQLLIENTARESAEAKLKIAREALHVIHCDVSALRAEWVSQQPDGLKMVVTNITKQAREAIAKLK